MPHKKTSDTKTQTNQIWSFPPLQSAPRIFTRHFTNLNFCLDQNELSLLCFLIFMSEQDNSIDYSVKILQQYQKAVKLAQERYERKKLKTSIPTTRKLFSNLIEKGLLLKRRDHFIINPYVTYSKQVSLKTWKAWDGNGENWLVK